MNKNNLIRIILSIIIICPMIIASSAYSYEVVLTAIDSESFRVGATNWASYGDNRLRAYSYPVYSQVYDGFIKFDLSLIPDSSVIESMTLTTYLDGPFNPLGNTSVRAYRVADDSWSRGYSQNVFYPGINEVLTGFNTNFSSGDLVPYDWKLNICEVNWSADLSDNILSLALHNENPSEYNYVYFYGSDISGAPPTLKIQYYVTPVPEPVSMLLFGTGIVGIGGYIRKRFKQN